MLLFNKPGLRFIRGHALENFISMVDTSFRWSTYFVLRFPARPLLGLVGELASPPTVTCNINHGLNMPRTKFNLVYKICVVQHLG